MIHLNMWKIAIRILHFFLKDLYELFYMSGIIPRLTKKKKVTTEL